MTTTPAAPGDVVVATTEAPALGTNVVTRTTTRDEFADPGHYVRRAVPTPSGAWHVVRDTSSAAHRTRCGRTLGVLEVHTSNGSTIDPDDVCHRCVEAGRAADTTE